MHVAEEVFRTIRMSQLEFERLATEMATVIEEADIDVSAYPMLNRFLGAVDYCAGEPVADIHIEEPADEPDRQEEPPCR